MGYIDSHLLQGEKVIIQGKINPLAAVPFFLLAFVCVIAAILAVALIKNVALCILAVMLCALFIVIGIVYIRSLVLVVTDRRIIGKKGILSVKSTDYYAEAFEAIGIKAGLLGRMFHYKTVVITGANSFFSIRFRGISNSDEVRAAIIELMENRRREARAALSDEIAQKLATCVAKVG